MAFQNQMDHHFRIKDLLDHTSLLGLLSQQLYEEALKYLLAMSIFREAGELCSARFYLIIISILLRFLIIQISLFVDYLIHYFVFVMVCCCDFPYLYFV